jgi:hypothetical protein
LSCPPLEGEEKKRGGRALGGGGGVSLKVRYDDG